jgi:uncharacterized protein
MRGGSTVRMHIGACVVTLHLEASRSLKDKRQVIRSLIERTHRKYNAAIAEIEEQDAWQTAVLGLAVVSNEAGHAERQIECILESIEETRLDAEIVDRQIEVTSL